MGYKIEKKAPHAMQRGEQNHTFHLRMPHELFEKAKVKAVMYNKSLAQVVREFLEDWTSG